MEPLADVLFLHRFKDKWKFFNFFVNPVAKVVFVCCHCNIKELLFVLL